MEDKQFDKSKYGLKTLRLEVWLGFIFVNLDANAEPLAPRLEPLKESFKNFHIEKMNVVSKEVTIWKTNWKILCENFIEAYHLDSVHGNSLYALGGTDTCIPGDHTGDYNFYLFTPHDTDNFSDTDLDDMVKPGVLLENPDLTDFERIHSPVGCIYPNLLISLSWFGGSYMTAQPLCTGELRVERVHYAPVTGLPFNSEAANEFTLKKLNDWAGVEDREMVEDVYRSAQSGCGKAGPLHIKHEETIYHFIRYLSRKLANCIPPA
jgi:phenylpropionate dioxygenase-like ring-hydroxylating dioxygenase large terminal subunit